MKKQKNYVAVLLVVIMVMALVGCGMKKSKDKNDEETTTGWSVENPDNTTEEKDNGKITGDLGTGAFETYEDAKEYLMNKLEEDNENISYEFREETKNLISYDSQNPGAEGYQFHVYEAEGGKKTGDYYVDKDSGKIYLYTNDNKMTEY